jgi:putative methyltransferase (TIGR04325 family)
MSGLKARVLSAAEVLLARHRSRLSGAYVDHAAAVAAGHRSGGYEDTAITRLVVDRTVRFAQERSAAHVAADEVRMLMYGAIHAAAQAAPDTLRVLDFGGAAGAHFHLARRWLPHRAMRWCVVETAAMGAAANAAGAARDGLEFHTTLDSALARIGRPHLVYANNALQYASDPLRTLRDLLGCEAQITCISKLAVAGIKATLFTRQESWLSENGPGAAPTGLADARVSYPLGILPRDEVRELIERSAELQLHFVHSNKLFHRDCGLIEYHAFVLRGRSQQES